MIITTQDRDSAYRDGAFMDLGSSVYWYLTEGLSGFRGLCSRGCELFDPTESLLLPLLSLSLPAPPAKAFPNGRLTTVGELSLDVVSGALLSTAAIPAGRK